MSMIRIPVMISMPSCANSCVTEYAEVPRGEWDAMTMAAREVEIDAQAQTFLENNVVVYWSLDDVE